MPPALPFDAVLLIAFGGPLGPGDIRPFLQNVLRARRLPPERIEAVAHHYERFGGVSPITAITTTQAAGLELRLRNRGLPLPVHVGMRNWKPHLAQALAEMAGAGAHRAVAIVAAAHRCYSSCEQYKQNVWQAEEELRAAGIVPPRLVYAGDWHRSPGFIGACADRLDQARRQLPAHLKRSARVIFTAHSIPTGMSAADTYVRQLRESAEAVAAELSLEEWTMAFQSRSGRPEDPWLEPDVNDVLRAARAEGAAAALVSPIGFVADHIEVLYDLEIEAKATAQAIGLPMVLASAVNDHPRFLDALAEAVADTVARYANGAPLTVLPVETPAKREPPPPVR
jgi:ferrochelatase